MMARKDTINKFTTLKDLLISCVRKTFHKQKIRVYQQMTKRQLLKNLIILENIPLAKKCQRLVSSAYLHMINLTQKNTM